MIARLRLFVAELVEGARQLPAVVKEVPGFIAGALEAAARRLRR